MKIVTFNIRFNNPNDGEFSFEHRKEEVIRRIQAEQPDVIGFQEIRDEVQAWMEEQLPEYAWVGHGRTAQLDGEHCPVIYRKDKFKLRNFQCFWLSDTPNIPGSKFENQGYHPRICNMLLLYSVEDKKTIGVFNTHLCNISVMRVKNPWNLCLQRVMNSLQEKKCLFLLWVTLMQNRAGRNLQQWTIELITKTLPVIFLQLSMVSSRRQRKKSIIFM